MSSPAERVVHFTDAERVGELFFGNNHRWFTQWQIAATLDPPMSWEELHTELLHSVPDGSEDPLLAYMITMRDVEGTLDTDGYMADGFTITHQRMDHPRDETIDERMKEHLQNEVAPAIATALGARLIQD